MRHTPAPWWTEGDDYITHVFAKDGDGEKCVCHASVEIDEYTTANMRLIAAAPDMLAALEMVLEVEADAGEAIFNAPHYQQIVDAIKKATGK